MHMLLWQLKGLSTAALPPSLVPPPQEAMAVAALRALASLSPSLLDKREEKRRTGGEGRREKQKAE